MKSITEKIGYIDQKQFNLDTVVNSIVEFMTSPDIHWDTNYEVKGKPNVKDLEGFLYHTFTFDLDNPKLGFIKVILVNIDTDKVNTSYKFQGFIDDEAAFYSPVDSTVDKKKNNCGYIYINYNTFKGYTANKEELTDELKEYVYHELRHYYDNIMGVFGGPLKELLHITLIADEFNITDSELASDMAFVLPYDKEMYAFSDSEKIGINVSGLLYKGGFNEKNQFNLSLNYKKLVDQILSTLIKSYEVHLIPHVIDFRKDAHDDDYMTCKILHEKYPETILAPAFNTPIEAKSYISNMKIFIGSRMHSTIAAFSSDVVTIPISYGRKFEGLFNSLNYEYVINGREETTESAYLKILQYIEDFDKLRNIQEKSLEIIKEKNNKFSNSIRNVLTNS